MSEKELKNPGARVKVQQYVNEQLVVFDFYYNTLEEALEYARNKDAAIVKVYNEYDEVVYDSTAA